MTPWVSILSKKLRKHFDKYKIRDFNVNDIFKKITFKEKEKEKVYDVNNLYLPKYFSIKKYKIFETI